MTKQKNANGCKLPLSRPIQFRIEKNQHSFSLPLYVCVCVYLGSCRCPAHQRSSEVGVFPAGAAHLPAPPGSPPAGSSLQRSAWPSPKPILLVPCERERDRETGRQRDRETGRQRDRETGRQRDREIVRGNDVYLSIA